MFRNRLIPLLLVVLVAGCGGRPRVRFPAQLPAEPEAWPLPAGRNVVQLRSPALGAGPQSLSLPLTAGATGLRGMLERCQLTSRTPVTRLILALPKLDELTEGATVVLQGTFDAPTVIQCLTRSAARLVLKPFRIGPYPGARGRLVSRSLLLLATARNTLIIAVGGDAERVPRVLRGQKDGLSRADQRIHFGPGAADAAITLTSHRLYGKAASIFSGPLLWAIDVTRWAWVRIWMRTPQELSLQGAIRTGGTFSAIRLQVQWKIITAIVSRTHADAGVLLRAMTARRKGHGLELTLNGGPAERAAFDRVTRGLFRRLGAPIPADPSPGPSPSPGPAPGPGSGPGGATAPPPPSGTPPPPPTP